MPGFTRSILITLAACLAFAGMARAEETNAKEMRSLDEQVQEIKSDALGIAAELSGLEEKLLYPSGTEIAVFVQIAKDEKFRLDAVQIHIDGQLATHYIYSFKELEALQKGGVQRIYTGNVPTGAHEMEVSINGKLEGGKDFNESEKFNFTKDVKPALLGITLKTPGSAQAIELEDW
jgi:hypothetical protein